MASFQDLKDKALTGAVALVVGMMWYDIREMRNDIKSLITQSSSYEARIVALERAAFNKSAYKVPFPPSEQDHLPLRHEMVAVLRDENLTPTDDETLDRRAKRKLLDNI